jgi:hypothetical protein
MIEILIKLHKTDFVIYEIFLIITFCIWYWTLFMGGAKKWSEGIIAYWGKHASRSMSHPTVLKIFMTIFLLATIGGGYGILLNKINNF